jgi:hypothetical protein
MAQIDYFEEQVKFNDIPVGGPKPLVGGDYLISLGMKPGPVFGDILGKMYDLQLEGELETVAEAQHWIIKELGHRYEQAAAQDALRYL